MVAKQSFPPVRESKMRPMTETRSPVAASAGRSANFSRNSAMVVLRG